jgi:hypothetical protein
MLKPDDKLSTFELQGMQIISNSPTRGIIFAVIILLMKTVWHSTVCYKLRRSPRVNLIPRYPWRVQNRTTTWCYPNSSLYIIIWRGAMQKTFIVCWYLDHIGTVCSNTYLTRCRLQQTCQTAISEKFNFLRVLFLRRSMISLIIIKFLAFPLIHELNHL